MRKMLLATLLLLLPGCGDGGGGGGGTAVAGGLPGEAIFDGSQVRTFELDLPPQEWDALVATADRTWRRCRLTWNGETYDDVAIRAAGSSTRFPGNPKPSLRVKLDEYVPDRKFHGLSGFKLNALREDPSMIRERIVLPLFASQGLTAPRFVHCRVTVNGAYKGLYGVQDRVTKAYVRHRFGEPLNQLYKYEGEGEDLAWVGENPGFYVPLPLEPRIDELPAGETEIRDLIDVLNRGTYEQVAAAFDVDWFIRFMAVEAVTADTNGYVGGATGIGGDDVVYSSNFFLYKHPGSGKHVFITWDRNETYWRPPGQPMTTGYEQRVLTRRLILERPENLARLKAVVRDMIGSVHATDRMHAEIDRLFAQVEEHAYADPFKDAASNQVLGWEVDDLKRIIQARNEALLLETAP